MYAVTGAAGLVGMNLLKQLEGEARVLVHRDKKKRLSGFGVESVFGDVTDSKDVDALMDGAEVCFHIAAITDVKKTIENPKLVFYINLTGTLHVLEAARKYGTKVVYLGTANEYGKPEYLPIDESHPLRPLTPYSASKCAAGLACLMYNKAYGLETAVIRSAPIYGPYDFSSRFIPSIIAKLLKGDVLEVETMDFAKDYLFAADVAEALVAASKSKEAIGEAINTGIGKQITAHEIVRAVCSALGKNIESIRIIEKGTNRPKESTLESLQVSNKKARDMLGWNPKTSFADGIQKTVEWFKMV